MIGASAVSSFAYKAHWADLPAAVQVRSRWALADTLGVALAGRASPAGTAAARMADAEPGVVQLVGSNATSSPVLAAMANGVAASALDFDDGHYLGGGIHPGAPVISALLSVSAPATTWGELLCAQTIGYEVAIRAGGLLVPLTPGAEYHASGTAGALGAAVAVAKLLGLDENGILRALRIASAHAPIARLQLSMAKESIGWSAATGVVAAQMAAAGFGDVGRQISSLPILDGFAETPFDDRSLRESGAKIAPLGSSWEILATYVKPYACCRAIHAALDGVLSIMEEAKLTAGELDRVSVSTIRGGLGLNFLAPATLEHAQFSFPFAIGAVAVFGRLGTNEMVGASLKDPRVAAVAERVVIEHHPDLDDPPAGNYPARVLVTGSWGSLGAEVPHAKGSARAPLSEVALKAKFRASAMSALPTERVDRVLRSALESSPESVMGDFVSGLGLSGGQLHELE
jgi:2-methylcitrate dehydratase PrpD